MSLEASQDAQNSQPASCSIERLSSLGHAGDDPNRSQLLADHTTFGVGGLAAKLIAATQDAELVDAVQHADAAGAPLLVLGGGSNVLISDEGFAGHVVCVETKGIDADVSSCGGAYLRVKAGEIWDDLVQTAIENDWSGIEALSGIPGRVGASPVQNIGAYGQEVAQTVTRVITWDRQANAQRTFTFAECGFGYRDSIFKRSAAGDVTGRYVITEVHFQLRNASLSQPIAYQQLADALGVKLGARAPMTEVRKAVLELRRSKAMVHDPADVDSHSAGSFFTNPILTAQIAERLPAPAPRFAQPDGTVKTSAAWLIEHAGFGKGYPGQGAARLSSKHVLALTNQGGARADEIVALAREIRAGVQARFGVELVPEPVLVGLSL